MTDLNKLRSEFEATPEIKAILEVMTVKFVAGFYVSVGFGIEIYTPYNALLNFAWDLWQEKAKAQAVPVWISVDDKWPEYGQSILVVINGLTQTRVFYRDGSDCSEDWIEPVNDEDRNNIWWNKVTYWMPLPTAPSESGAEG